MHVKPGQYTSVMQRYLKPFPLKLFEKAVKIKTVTRQDSRHRGLEESRDAKHVYCLKASTAKVDWPCYKNA